MINSNTFLRRFYLFIVAAALFLGGGLSTNAQTPLPWNEGFESGYTNQSTTLPGWTQELVSGSYYWTTNSTLTNYNRTPRSGSWNAYLHYSANTWMFKSFDLTAGVTYQFQMYARQDVTSGCQLEVKYGTTASAAGMTTSIIALTNVTNGDYQLFSGQFTPLESGTIYIGIHGVLTSTPWYLSIDDLSLVQVTGMEYVSSTTTAQSYNVAQGAENMVVLGLQIVTNGLTNPLTLNSATFTTTGSTLPSDIADAKLWYSGTSNNLGAAVQVGGTITNPNGSFTFTPTGEATELATLANGTNYFWLSYSVSPTAVPEDILSASCSGFYLGTTEYSPTPQAPGSALTVKAPLSGTYTIDNTSPTAGTNFNNFGDALDFLNNIGVGGAVTFNVIANQTFPVTITNGSYAYYVGQSGTATEPIIFQKFGEGANPVISITGTSGTSDIGMFLYGCDYVTFNGINISDAGTDANTYLERGYYLQGPADNNCQFVTIQNCTVDLTKTNTNSRGIYSYSNAPTSLAGCNNNNSFLNNTIQDCYYGYQFTGNSTYFDNGNYIGSSLITNVGYSAIYFSYQTNLLINNSQITNSGGANAVYPVYASAGAANTVTFTNNVIDNFSNTGSTNYGVYFSAGTSFVVQNNTIQNCTATSTMYGYYITAGTSIFSGNTLSNLTLTGTSSLYGMYFSGTQYTVNNNEINGLTGGGSIYSMYLASATTANVFKNAIHNVAYSGTSSSILYGVYQTTGNQYIYNNLIYDLRAPAGTATTGAVRGMYFSGGAYVGAYYNTVYLDYVSTNASNTSCAVYASTSPTTLDMRNNIFINKTDVTTGTRAVAYWRSSTTYTNYSTLSNCNLFYAGVPSAKNLIFYDGTNSEQTLAGYKTRMATRDQAAKTEDVPFLSNTAPYNFHINPAVGTRVESGGIQVAAPIVVGDDFDGNIRQGEPGYTGLGVAPDIGAFEGNYTLLDDTPPTIVYTALERYLYFDNRTITATISDLTGVPTIGDYMPRIYFKKGVEGTWYSTQGVFQSGSALNGTWQFTIDNTVMGGVTTGDVIYYYIIAQDVYIPTNIGSNPGGVVATDVNTVVTPPATPNSYTLVPSITGTFHVGTDKDYTTLTAAVTDFNAKFQTGPVTFLLDDATYTGETFPITINVNPGSSATNTLTIKPNDGVTTAITGSYDGALIKLNGADYVTIDGCNLLTYPYAAGANVTRDLTIQNNSTSTSACIWLSSLGAGAGATNNIIKNCNLIGGLNTATVFGVIASGTTLGTSNAGADNDYNTIENNTFKKMYYGIYFYGVSTDYNLGNAFKNNLIGSTVEAEYVKYYGIYGYYQGTLDVSGNEIFNMINSSGTGTGYPNALYLNNFTNTNINNNNIHDIIYTGTGGYSGTPMLLTLVAANAKINIFNNVIYSVAGDCDAADWVVNGIRLLGTNAGGVNIYHNSIYLTPNATYGMNYEANTWSACLIIDNGITGVNVKNNAFQSSLGEKTGSTIVSNSYAIASKAAAATVPFAALDNNIYFSSNADNNYTGCSVASAGPPPTNSYNFAAWQAWTLQDANSAYTDPLFTSTTNLYPQDGSPLIEAGAPLPAVTTDILGNPRDATNPTIGAYEYIPPEPAITLNDIIPAGYCWEAEIAVDFANNVDFENDNVFSAYIDGVETALGTAEEYIAGEYTIVGDIPSGLEAGYYNVYIVSSNPEVTSNLVQIYIAPPPTAVCPNDMLVCIEDEAFELTGGLPQGGVYSMEGFGITDGIFDPLIADLGEHVITYEYTDPLTGCSDFCEFTITVNDLPELECPFEAISVCQSNEAMDLNGLCLPIGGDFSGDGVVDNYFTPNEEFIGFNEVIYTYTDPETGCTNTCDFGIIVTAAPEVTCGEGMDYCENDLPLNLTLRSGFEPEGGTFSGDGVEDNIFYPAGLDGEVEITYTVEDEFTGCTNSCTFIMNIHPAPAIVETPEDYIICADENTEPQQLPVIEPIGGTYMGDGVYQDEDGLWYIDPLGAGIDGQPHEIYYEIYGDYDCYAFTTFNVIINPLPEIYCPEYGDVCNNDYEFPLIGGWPEGGEYAGDAVDGGYFYPALAEIGENIVTYTITDEVTGCQNTCEFVIVVNEAPAEPQCPQIDDICINGGAIILPQLAGEYDYYDGAGVYYDGNNWLFDPMSEETSLPGEYEVVKVVVNDNLCENYCYFYITVNNAPEVICNNFEVCKTDQMVDLFDYVNHVTGTFNGETVIENQYFDPSGLDAGEYLISYVYTDDNGCTGECQITALVKMAVAPTCPNDFAICIDAEPVELFGAEPIGGVYIGQGVEDGVFSPAIAGAGEHVINYLYTDPSGCQNECEFTITVYDLPAIDCPESFEICLNEAPVVLSELETETPGGVFYFDGSEITVFDPMDFDYGTFPIEYVYTDEVTGCTNSCEFDITVKTMPFVISMDFEDQWCWNDSKYMYLLALEGEYPIEVNYTDGSQVYNTTLEYDEESVFYEIEVFPTETTEYTLISATGANGCSFNYEDMEGWLDYDQWHTTVIVVPEPQEFQITPNEALCYNEEGFEIGLNGSQEGMEYALLRDGEYLDVYVGGSNEPVTFEGTFTEPGTYTIEGYWIDYDCSPVLMAGEFTILPLPEITCPEDYTVCIDAEPFLLGEVGAYFGQAVIDNTFYPEMAGIGEEIVGLIVTDEVTGCQNMCEFVITVNEAIQPVCPNDMVVCVNDEPFELTGATPEGGVYEGEGVVDGMFDASLAGVGSHTITYTVIDEFGCSGECEFSINVNDLPVVECPGDITVCANGYPIFLPQLGGNPSGGVFVYNDVPIEIFEPAEFGVGEYNLSYIYEDPQTGCVNSCEFTITVNPQPYVIIYADDEEVCWNGSTWINFEVLEGALPVDILVYDGGEEPYLMTLNNEFVSFEVTPTEDYTISIMTAIDENGCVYNYAPEEAIVTVNVIPQPDEFEMVPSGAFCNIGPFEIGLNGSQVGVEYKLLLDGNYTGDVAFGSGEAFNFEGLFTENGIYTVEAWYLDKDCDGTDMAGFLQINPAPVIFNVTGGGAYPQGGEGVPVGLDGSEDGFAYTLYFNGEATPNTVIGDGNAITFGNQTEEGTYNVVAMNPNTQCGEIMNGEAIVTINLAPVVFNVTGGGAYCAGGDGVEIGLDGSEEGVVYQLFNGEMPVNNAVPGTGEPISFGFFTEEGTYTATGTNITNLISTDMAEEATVTINPLPEVSIFGCQDVCIDAAPFEITAEPQGGEFEPHQGFEGKMFDPAVAGVGTHMLTYNYVDENGCFASATCTLEVRGLPEVTLADFADVCFGDPAYALEGGFPEGGIYSGDGVADNVFDPSAAGMGVHVITYTYTDDFGCTNFAENTIFVAERRIETNPVFEFCLAPGSQIEIPYTVSCQFFQDNTFRVYLSDENGDFENKLQIGEMQGTGDGVIACVIPEGLPTSALYKFRVDGSEPNTIGIESAGTYTIGNLPTLSTIAPSNVTATSARSGGFITSNGGLPVTQSGICWSTSPMPTIDDAHTTDGSVNGQYVSTATGLSPLTRYYVRAYATNCVGTAYGTQYSFVTTQFPSVVITLPNKNTCRGVSINIANGAATVTGGSGNFAFNWSPAIYLNSTTIMEPNAVNPMYSQNYTLTVTDLTTGLVYRKTMTMTVNQPTSPTLPSLVRVASGTNTVDLNSYVSNPIYVPGNGYTYNWFDNSTPRVPVIEPALAPLTSSLTRYNLVLDNPSGCTAAEKGITFFRPMARFNGSDEDLFVDESGRLVGVVYPTPTSGALFLELAMTNEANVNVSIMNLVGQIVQTVEFNNVDAINHEFDLSGLAAGNYIIVIRSGNDVVMKSIIKY